MKAHEIIDRLASLDEASTVEEPQVEPDIAEPTIEPDRPAPRRRNDPFSVPPDFEPGQMPRPKAEDASEAIRDWLEATQQPIQDWDWNGHELRMLMDDGTTEVYNRTQLDEIGVFSGNMAFAESFEDEHGIGLPVSPEADWLDDNDRGLPPTPADDQAINDVAAGEAPDEASGVLDQILGRTSGGSCGCGDTAAEEPSVEVIQIDASGAAEVMSAISDVVQAILGVTGVPEEGESDKKTDKSEDDSEDETDKPKKEKESSEKKKDKKTDKSDDKETDDKDEDDE